MSYKIIYYQQYQPNSPMARCEICLDFSLYFVTLVQSIFISLKSFPTTRNHLISDLHILSSSSNLTRQYMLDYSFFLIDGSSFVCRIQRPSRSFAPYILLRTLVLKISTSEIVFCPVLGQ